MTNNDSPKNQGGSFSWGLFLGMAIGAGGFYIFGTKKGQKIKHQFIEEFDKAKEELEKSPQYAEANAKIHKAVAKWEKDPQTKQAIAEAKSLLETLSAKVQKLTAATTPKEHAPTKVYFKKK